MDATLVSSIALVHLLLHFCNDPPKKLGATTHSARKVARALLQVFHVGVDAVKAPSTQTFLRVLMDPQWQGRMGLSAGDELFPISGRLQSARIQANAGWQSLPSTVRKHVALGSHVDTWAVMLFTHKKKHVSWLSNQLAWGLANFLEKERLLTFQRHWVPLAESLDVKPRRTVCEKSLVLHKARAMLRGKQPAQDKKKKKKAKKDGKSDTNERVMPDHKDLVRYFFGCRREFENSNVLSICDDESRVGGKERLYMAAMSSNGITAWAPPQARRCHVVSASIISDTGSVKC